MLPTVKTQVVDKETGEILNESTAFRPVNVGGKKKSANYATMFLEEEESFEAMKGLGNFGAVWAYVLTNYKRENAIFFFSASTKEDACKVTGLSTGTIRSAISSFCDSGLLLKVRNAEYMVNPKHFFKGSWDQREGMIKEYDMKKEAVEILKSKKNMNDKTVSV